MTVLVLPNKSRLTCLNLVTQNLGPRTRFTVSRESGSAIGWRGRLAVICSNLVYPDDSRLGRYQILGMAGSHRNLPRCTVLVVDDEPSICWGFETLLGPQGYRVLTASSAEEALRLADVQPIDLVLLDVRLPGEDGLTALPKLRSDRRCAHHCHDSVR